MANDIRPESMERITNFALAEAFIEEQIAEKDALCEEFSSDYQKLMEIGEEKSALEAQLEELYLLWEELST